MSLPKKHSKIIFSIAHGTVIFFALWLINNSSYSSEVDEGLSRKIFLIEGLLFPDKHLSSPDFIFVNVSKDISLTDDPREWGKIAITDRIKLSQFFKILADNGNRHLFVLCDVFFEYPTENDSILLLQISRCRNLLFPNHIDKDTLQNPCIPVPAALGDYQTYNDNFSKFRLIYKDTLKTIPLILQERLNGRVPLMTVMNLRSFSPKYYITPYQLTKSKEYSYYNLGELLLISHDSLFYADYLKNKFVVLGNFETDVHSTPIGPMYGPLILINSYLSLRAGRAKVNWGWILFMVISLSITSYILFYVRIEAPKINISRWVNFIIENFVNSIFCFLGICSLIVFLSELLFSIQLAISPLFFYLTYVKWLISYYQESIKSQQS